MKVYTSSEILNADDLYELQDSFCSCGVPFKYQMTDGEIGWYKMIKDRYCIGDFIDQNTDDYFMLTFDNTHELSEALLLDNFVPYKAVMLSDDTALQKLFFWLNSND